MSDIVDFVAKNFRSLQPTDYLLLLIFAALVSIGLFVLFRSVYAARFAAQKDLLDLHAQKSSFLSEQLQAIRSEKQELEESLMRARVAIESSSTDPAASVNEISIAMLTALTLMSAIVLTVQHRATILYQFLLARGDLGLPEKRTEARAAAEALNARAELLQAALQTATAKPEKRNLDALFALLQASETERAMTRARAEAMTLAKEMQAFIAASRGA